MAISPQTLEGIRNPLSGLSNIGAMYAKGVEMKETKEKLSDARKTSNLQRQIYDAQLDKLEVNNLLDKSKILSGVVEQFKQDAQRDPSIAKDPNAYAQYMQVATEGMPDDVISEFQGINPSQFPQIGRRAARMVSVLTGVKEKKAPKTRKIGEMLGDKSYVVDQEWNSTTNKWDEVGRSEKSGGVTVNTAAKEESKFAFQQLTAAVKDSTAAQKTKDNVSYIKQVMKDVETGALTNLRLNLNRYGASFGFSIQEDIPNIAAANTAIGNMVMAGLNAFPGQISEGERKFLETRMPNIIQTPAGREQIMELLNRLADRPIAYRKLMNKFMKDNSNSLMPEGKDTFYDEWDKHKEKNVLFKGLDMLAGDEDIENINKSDQENDDFSHLWN